MFLSFIENHLSLTIYTFGCILFTSVILFLLIFCNHSSGEIPFLFLLFYYYQTFAFFFFKAREHLLKRICILLKKMYLFIYLTASPLRWRRAGCFVVVHRFFSCGTQAQRCGQAVSSCGTRASLLCGMWDLRSPTRN